MDSNLLVPRLQHAQLLQLVRNYKKCTNIRFLLKWASAFKSSPPYEAQSKLDLNFFWQETLWLTGNVVWKKTGLTECKLLSSCNRLATLTKCAKISALALADSGLRTSWTTQNDTWLNRLVSATTLGATSSLFFLFQEQLWSMFKKAFSLSGVPAKDW